MNNLPVLLLVCSSRDRRHSLLTRLEGAPVEVHAVGDLQQARALIENGAPVHVVMSDVTLSDGNWCNLLNYAVELGVQAPVVLSAADADSALWSEALWRGVYDILVEPFGSDEARKVVESALRAAKRPQHERVAPALAAAV